MSRRTNHEPSLHFSPSGVLEGFTSAGVQGFNELNPAAIVREFIQNSLDAVREDGREKAIVRFEIESMARDEIPAFDAYFKAFEAAVRDQKQRQHDGELSDQAAMVVDAIMSTLDKDEVEVLSVLDNGLGLDKTRMEGLLADGMSLKTSAGSGAVGNGHLTAIPASDLRYVLYGGVSREGKIASGHAILASFLSHKKAMGKDGYYALAVSEGMSNKYKFPSDDNMASLIKEKLDWIESNFDSKTGAAVIIPGFNRFRESGDALWETIRKAAACSFFAAIAEDHLEIAYRDDKGEKVLNKGNLGLVFSSDISSEKRARKFLSGSRAADAYKTTAEGERFSVDVECGKVELLIRKTTSGPSRIDLCRNGMWITQQLPRLQAYKFNDRRPFHCLMKVTAQDGEIHKLIRKSEGPLHNDLEGRKGLKKDERSKLNKAFDKIGECILSKVDELKEDEYAISDFLTVTSNKGVISGGIRGGAAGEYEALPPRRLRTPVTTADSDEGGGIEKGKKSSVKKSKRSKGFQRSGSKVSFGAVPVPTGERSYSVELFPQEDMVSDMAAEIRFVLDESIDETCDLTFDEQFVTLDNVRLNGKDVASKDLIKSDQSVLGIRLGQFRQGESHVLDFTYKLPDDITVREGENAVLRAEVVRRKAS